MNQIINLFPSSVHVIDIENYDVVKDKALSFIYNERKKSKDSVEISNRGGWQSNPDYYQGDNSIKKLIDKGLLKHRELYLDYKKLEYSALWFNINKKGNYNISHHHPCCDLAGLLWIKTPPKCGRTVFESSYSYLSSNHLDSLNEEYKSDTNNFICFNFNPVEGRMLIFPSHLRHSVEANESDEERVSVSFNLDIVNR